MAGTAISQRGSHTPVKSLGGEMVLIPFTFTAGASSGLSPALTYDYNDNISLTMTEDSPDLYIFSIGVYKQYLACVATSSLGATVNITPSGSAANGTVTLSVASNALAGATVSGCIYVLK